jgi:23S rRNA (adenine-N6)-dimethyltransferase
VWARQLDDRARSAAPGRLRVVRGDFLSVRMPSRAHRIVGCPPFGQTTPLLRRILDHPDGHLERADPIVQWEVARKRTACPPTTLLSTVWTPCSEFRSGARVPARQFRPVPRVDSGVLTILARLILAAIPSDVRFATVMAFSPPATAGSIPPTPSLDAP